MAPVLANPVEMIERGAPHVIHNDEELEVYTKALFNSPPSTIPTLRRRKQSSCSPSSSSAMRASIIQSPLLIQ